MKKLKILTLVSSIAGLSAAIPAISSCTSTPNNQNENTVEHTITFKQGVADSITGTLKVSIKENRKFGSIDKPTVVKKDWTFRYWMQEGTEKEVNDTDKITQDMVLVPYFTNSDPKITFNTVGGGTIEPITVEYETTWGEIPAEKKPADPTKEGAEFKQWILEDHTPIYDDYSFKKDTILTADWIEDVPTGYCKVTFVDNGTVLSSQVVKAGQTCLQPSEPQKTNYVFTGWYNDSTFSESFDFSTPIQSNKTIYAKFITEAEAYCCCMNNESEEESTLTCTIADGVSMSYSTDSLNWTTVTSGDTINFTGKLYLKGDNKLGLDGTNRLCITNGKVTLSGFLSSLLDNGTNSIKNIPTEKCFSNLFENSTGVVDISDTFLNFEYMNKNCYQYMFQVVVH